MAQTQSSAHVHFPPSTTTKTTTMSYSSITTTSSPPDEHTRPRMADGRRNSHGEILVSPIEEWKPDMKRRQSFQREELKRAHYTAEVLGDDKEMDAARGFTEGGAGTRQI